MAEERIKGLVNCSVNFEVNKTAPLDSRTVVSTVLGLTETDTWVVDGKVWLYDGLVVAVKENQGLYQLKGFDKDPLAYSSIDNWVRLDSGAVESLEVVDSLTSADSTKALAASQGKILNEKIDEVKNSLTSVYNYKGSVDTYSSLPNNAVKGDVYNVVAANGATPAGTNYAWTGTSWDALGGSVDLSGYYTKTEVDSAITEAVESVDISDQLTGLETKINSNTAALNVINGTNEGSLAHTLKTAKDYTDTQLLTVVTKEEGKELISTDKLELIDTTASNLELLEDRVEATEASLNVLNGSETTSGSVLNIVKTQINNALDWQEID